MRPPDPEIESLLQQWIEKADADLEVARRLAAEAGDSSRILKTLLHLAGGVNSPIADSLSGATWLTPFGAEIRYPGEAAEMLPGDETKAIEIASEVKRALLGMLSEG